MTMEQLRALPEDYLEPLIPCFDLLTKCNVHIFDDRSPFRRAVPDFYILPAVLAYNVALTIYLIEGFKSGMGLDELVYVVPVYVVCVQTIFKASIVVSNQKHIRSIILRLGQLWRTQELSEVQISKKNVLLKRLKFCYAAFYWMNLVGSWQYILSPLLETVFRRLILRQDTEFRFPFGCYFPFDARTNWIVYLAAYLFEGYSMMKIVYSYLGSEFLMIILCSHLATEFTLLQLDVQGCRPGNRNVSHFNEREQCAHPEPYVNEKTELKALIRRHQILIGLAKDLDDIFNKMIFVNLSSTTFSICFFGFAAKVSHDTVSLINNFMAVVALMLPIFNLCYYAEILKEASESIAVAAYKNIWYNGSNAYVKAIWFIMKRSQKPCCLTSLRYNAISLSTFTAVMSTTWSYFSLASSLYDESAEAN